jgi:hypothetical protein
MTSTGSSNAADDDQAPLISTGFLNRLTVAIAVIALLTVGISFAGRWYGQRMALAGHTDSSQIFTVRIGQDHLQLAANTIRFHDQRKDGVTERIDLYLTWPDLQGYSAERRRSFDDLTNPGGLVFLQLSQSTMSKDMSGRLAPIYSHLFAGEPRKLAHGLTMHRLSAESGYGNEVVFTAPRKGKADYVVRCLLPAEGREPTGGDCQRDIHIGNDLTVLYRFSSAILEDWDHIDAAITAFVESRLGDQSGRTNGGIN